LAEVLSVCVLQVPLSMFLFICSLYSQWRH